MTTRARTPVGMGGLPPSAVTNQQRIHPLRQYFSVLHAAMEAAIYDAALCHCSMEAGFGAGNLPAQRTVRRGRHPRAAHETCHQFSTLVNITLAKKELQRKGGKLIGVAEIISVNWAANSCSERDPKTYPNRHPDRRHLAMKKPNGAEAQPVQTFFLSGRSTKVKVVTRGNAILQEGESDVFAGVRPPEPGTAQIYNIYPQSSAYGFGPQKARGIEQQHTNGCESGQVGAGRNAQLSQAKLSQAKPSQAKPSQAKPS